MNVFGIILFLIFGGLAFWMLFFLLGFIAPLWITLAIREKFRPKRIFEDKEE
jgi:ABC-type microcin C transport system permease subunit YejB